MSWPRRLTPRTLAAQMGLLLVGALLIAQGLTALVFVQERGESFRSDFLRSAIARVAGAARLIEDAPPSLARRIARGADGPGLRLRFSDTPPPGRGQDVAAPGLAAALARTLGRPGEDVRALAVASEARRAGRIGRPRAAGIHLAVRLRWRDGPPRPSTRRVGAPEWLIAEVSPPRPPPVGRTFVTGFLVSAAAIMLAGWLLARRLARPLRHLRHAAERLGRGEAAEPLAPAGPSELRGLTSAFNEMQERLARLLNDRTVMLAALGHDLRTPITSLRLRAEFIEDDETRARMLETLAEMQAMTEETLAFARDDAVAEPRRHVDLTALVESLVEDVRERGSPAEVVTRDRVAGLVRVTATRRALRNLIENAVAYGEAARVTLARTERDVVIDIEDDGPGIPAADRARVFDPFVRLETSRSRATGGTGLGLAIARALIRAQGGDVTLANEPRGGLRARVTLPIRASSPS